MPGPWIYFKENGDFFADFKVEKGEYYECHQYDPEKSPQGFALWQVKSLVETNKDGIWVNARLVAVSDSHLHWWVTKGPGKDEKRKFNLHLCAKDFAQCRRGRGRGPMEFHSDHFRVLSAHDISDLRVSWFKDREAKEDMKLEVERLMGKEKEAPQRGSRKRPLAESTSEREEGDLPAAVEHPEGSGAVTEGLKKLRSEVDKDKKNEDDKKDAPRRRRERLRHEERDLDKKKEKEKGKMAKKPDNKPRGKGNWFGEKGEPQHSASDSMDTKSDDTPRRAKKKRKKRRKAKQADRGPFGVGRRVKFGEGSTEGSRESNSEDSDQVFQAAPSDKSRQLQLMEYSQQYPGRLAARLLTKMQELLAREEGALNPVGRNQTPAAATSYFLTEGGSGAEDDSEGLRSRCDWSPSGSSGCAGPTLQGTRAPDGGSNLGPSPASGVASPRGGVIDRQGRKPDGHKGAEPGHEDEGSHISQLEPKKEKEKKEKTARMPKGRAKARRDRATGTRVGTREETRSKLHRREAGTEAPG